MHSAPLHSILPDVSPVVFAALPVCTTPYLNCALTCRTLHLADVTLVVAKQDFLILLSAAHRGDRWKSGARRTAYLVSGISKFEPAEFSRSSITLSEYRCVKRPVARPNTR